HGPATARGRVSSLSVGGRARGPASGAEAARTTSSSTCASRAKRSSTTEELTAGESKGRPGVKAGQRAVEEAEAELEALAAEPKGGLSHDQLEAMTEPRLVTEIPGPRG